MTAQLSEALIMDDERHRLFETPLDDYFRLMRMESPFPSGCSACWRGYLGTWELTNGRLYLTRLGAEMGEASSITIADLFPGFPDRVFAHWFSGCLRLPQGEQIEYIHMGFSRQHERDLFIDIRQGCEIGRRIVDNTRDADSTPEQAT